MAFSTNMQAYFVDRFYRRLRERFSERQTMGALTTAFHQYVFQRGSRAAQRAVQDGAPLDFEHYHKYREVVSTEEMKREDGPGRSERDLSPELYEGRIYDCTTHRLFRQLDSPEQVEQFFCKHIDSMNVRSFNPDIPYWVESTLYDADVCLHRSPNPGCPAETDIGARMPDAPPFPYLLANQFYSMSQVIEAIFGLPGREICQAVQSDFIARYGQADWNQIARYQGADFNLYYPLGLKNRGTGERE